MSKTSKARTPSKPISESTRPMLIRDSFSMPESEYETLAAIRVMCLKSGLSVKKSELLRAAIQLVGTLSIPEVKQKQAALKPLQAGRPKKVYPAGWEEC